MIERCGHRPRQNPKHPPKRVGVSPCTTETPFSRVFPCFVSVPYHTTRDTGKHRKPDDNARYRASHGTHRTPFSVSGGPNTEHRTRRTRPPTGRGPLNRPPHTSGSQTLPCSLGSLFRDMRTTRRRAHIGVRVGQPCSLIATANMEDDGD